MIIEIRNYKYFSLFLISFLFLFTSIIPFLEGSLFDYTFLLGSIPLWIFNILNRKIFSRVEILILIYFLISTIQLFSLILIDAQLFISSIPIYLRINGTLIIFDLLLFTILRNKNKSNLYLNYFLLFPFSLFTLLVSSWGVINSLRGVSWRLGFPLYSDGLDPHVFGPAMACAFIGLFYIFINFKDYYDGKNKNLLRILIFLGIVSCISATLFCGSRGGLLILLGFSITCVSSILFKKKNIIFNVPTKIKKTNLLVISLFSIFVITFFNVITNLSGQLGKLIFRTFSILPVIYGTDESRSGQLKVINELISESYNFLFSRNNVFSNADVGPKFFIYNQGLILFLLFISIYIFIFLILLRLNSFSASIFIAGLLLLIFASATLLIPRFYVIYLYSFTILATQEKFKNIPK